MERPGGHGPPKAFSRPAAAMPEEPRYLSATGEYYHPRPLKGPGNFQRARQPLHPDAPVRPPLRAVRRQKAHHSAPSRTSPYALLTPVAACPELNASAVQ
jgi:hypothetical protein